MTKPDEKSQINRLKDTIGDLNREISDLSQQNQTLTAEKKILDTHPPYWPLPRAALGNPMLKSDWEAR